jgi:ribosomal protein L24
MIRRLFSRSPRVGDLVTVLQGAYAGKTGTITAVADAGFTVYIDDCCQPVLDEAAFRREWRGRGIPGASRKARAANVDGELARAELESRDNSTFGL